MKNLITKLLVIVIALGLATAPAAYARDGDDNSSSDKGSLRSKTKEHRDEAKKALEKFRSKKSDDADARLKALIEYGDKIVAQRQKALEEMQKRLSSGRCSKIETGAKSSITTLIASMKTTLESQKTTIDKSANLEEAKTNITAVFDNRVFSRFIPALNGICSAQRIIDLVNGKLATAFTELKAAGKDTSSFESEMSKAKVAAQTAQDLFKKVAASPKASDAKANLDTGKAKLKEAKRALEAAKTALEKLRDQSESDDDNPKSSSDDSR